MPRWETLYIRVVPGDEELPAHSVQRVLTEYEASVKSSRRSYVLLVLVTE